MSAQFHTHPSDLQDMSKVERAYMQLKYLQKWNITNMNFVKASHFTLLENHRIINKHSVKGTEKWHEEERKDWLHCPSLSEYLGKGALHGNIIQRDIAEDARIVETVTTLEIRDSVP